MRASTGNQAESELLTRVLMLQFWSFKRSSLCFSGSKIHQHGWRRDFNAPLCIFISEPLDCSLISLSFDIIFARLASQLFQFLICVASSSRSLHLSLEIPFWYLLMVSPSLPLVGWAGKQATNRDESRHKSHFNWDWMGTNHSWGSRSLCIPNVSFLESRGSE